MPNAKKPGLHWEAGPISNPRRMQGERSRRPIPKSRPGSAMHKSAELVLTDGTPHPGAGCLVCAQSQWRRHVDACREKKCALPTVVDAFSRENGGSFRVPSSDHNRGLTLRIFGKHKATRQDYFLDPHLGP